MLTGEMLRRSAMRFASKPAVIWQDQCLTYRELDIAANRLAQALLQIGVSKGEKVGIVCRNRPEYAVAFFGVARTGAVLVSISTLYPAEELAWVLEKADVTILFYEDIFAEKVQTACRQNRTPLPRCCVRIGGQGNNASESDLPFDAFIAQGSPEPPNVQLAPTDAFCMTYTGGTTGRPKGVLCSHLNRFITAHTVAVEEALDERDVVGIVTPMFHVAALNIMFQPAILVGATTTLLSKWDVQDFAAMVRRTGMTAAFMVPTQIAMLLGDTGFDPRLYATWRKLSFAGAPMPDWVQKEMLCMLPQVAMTQIYGQSEMGVLTALRAWYLPEKLGTIGRQAYNVEVALVDAQGQPVAAGTLGEIASRGNNVMLEYYKEPGQTVAIWRNGWALTGDVGVMDAEGFITLVDRAKDMVISGGENVYPKEIENVLYELEPVAECAVFGIPDNKWGEVLAAYVRLHPQTALTEAQIAAHCQERLARFKCPRLIRFVSSFPKTPIGKIQKNLLREKYWLNREKKI